VKAFRPRESCEKNPNTRRGCVVLHRPCRRANSSQLSHTDRRQTQTSTLPPSRSQVHALNAEHDGSEPISCGLCIHTIPAEVDCDYDRWERPPITEAFRAQSLVRSPALQWLHLPPVVAPAPVPRHAGTWLVMLVGGTSGSRSDEVLCGILSVI
jgi:hypothetical protein